MSPLWPLSGLFCLRLWPSASTPPTVLVAPHAKAECLATTESVEKHRSQSSSSRYSTPPPAEPETTGSCATNLRAKFAIERLNLARQLLELISDDEDDNDDVNQRHCSGDELRILSSEPRLGKRTMQERITMSGLLDPSSQKIPEKLLILNDRVVGLTARIYNIKKKYENPKTRPSFFTEKNLDNSIKYIMKKFPQFDIRGSSAPLNPLNFLKDDVLNTLQPDYDTFVDVLELRDHVNELLTTISACRVKFNLPLNFDLTYFYLNLISGFTCLMILVSTVEHRKLILGLYSLAYELKNMQSESNFPRLGQMTLDYECPLKRISEDFSPHCSTLKSAVNSIAFIYGRRNLSAEKWREVQLLSLTSSPQSLLSAAETDTIPCEYLSLETMNRWIIISLSICHPTISQPLYSDLWAQALKSCIRFPLYRDECLYIHRYLQSFLEDVNSNNKRIKELKEFNVAAVQNAFLIHRERRKFLRSALRQLWLLLSDEPGLIAPKLLLVLMGVAFSRDEVEWLLRHTEAVTDRVGSKTKAPVDRTDRELPELLFYMTELRDLVLRYGDIVRCYYLQYLKGFDAPLLEELTKNAAWMPDAERTVINSIIDALSTMYVDMLDPGNIDYDFAAIRLDLCRLQVYSESHGVSFEHNPRFANAVNTAIFHLKAVDELDRLMKDNSDLSLNCFYSSLLTKNFRFCLRVPNQARYVSVFAGLCADFTHVFHSMCPEERTAIGKWAINTCDSFLKETVIKAVELFAELCKHMEKFSEWSIQENSTRKKILDAKSQTGKKGQRNSKLKLLDVSVRPGEESYRKFVEDTTEVDMLHFALTETCLSIDHYDEIVVWSHVFSPRVYLVLGMEDFINRELRTISEYEVDKPIIKPSRLLQKIFVYADVLSNIARYVKVDVKRIIHTVMLQQSQLVDASGAETCTSHYINWYLEWFFPKVSLSRIWCCPNEKTFVMNPGIEDVAPLFDPQEYADYSELRHLVSILGPYGVLQFKTKLATVVAEQLNEIKKLAVQFREVLRMVKADSQNSDKCRQLLTCFATGNEAKSKEMDICTTVLQRMRIIGEVLYFKELLQEALLEVLAKDSFVLLRCAESLRNEPPHEHADLMDVYEMCSAAGMKCPVDTDILTILEKDTDNVGTEERTINALTMTLMACSLARVVGAETDTQKKATAPVLSANHIIVAKAVSTLASVLFWKIGEDDTRIALESFLTTAINCAYNLGRIIGPEAVKNADIIYSILDQVVQESPYVQCEFLETRCPYILRRAYRRGH